ncbi:type VI secretion system ImpA family N-terminal domain-containing protein [Enterobacter kobei]|nr:type VI secretion system ImpA family N-terminal domain-containing protein [Enterobacter kobei]
MKIICEHLWRVGGDPSTMVSYRCLVGELDKWTNSAKHHINWRFVETHCLNLFELNGTELQTASWYTQARTHLVGLRGMNEGLAILNALFSTHWEELWPQSIHTRLELLNNLSDHLQQYLRTRVPGYMELSELYQIKHYLFSISVVLQHQGLNNLASLEALAQQLNHIIVQLENRSVTANTSNIHAALCSSARMSGLENISVSSLQSYQLRPWFCFITGMFTMFFVGILSMWGWGNLSNDPNLNSLVSTVTPLPESLKDSTLTGIQQQGQLKLLHTGQIWFPMAHHQLEQLATLSPAWTWRYGMELVNQAQVLWPHWPETTALARQWEQQVATIAASEESLAGWQQGMDLLQALICYLNGLDEKKGQNLTVSELKSQMIAINQAFNQTIPTEELLRQIADRPAGAPVPEVLIMQTDLHFKKLLARYVLLIPPGEEYSSIPK